MSFLENVVLVINAAMLMINAVVLIFAWHYVEEHKIIIQQARRNEFNKGINGSPSR